MPRPLLIPPYRIASLCQALRHNRRRSRLRAVSVTKKPPAGVPGGRQAFFLSVNRPADNRHLGCVAGAARAS